MRARYLIPAMLVPPALEGLAIFALASGASWPALALHLASAGVLAEVLYAGSSPKSLNALWTGWFWGGAFPLFGPLVGILLCWQLGQAGSGVSGVTWEERRKRAARAALEEKQSLQQIPPDILPLVDALRDGDANVRISAIEAMRDSRSKSVVQLLARERDNEIYEVRFRAVEALTRIAKRNLDEIAIAKQELTKAPASYEANQTLATLYFEHADLAIDSAEVNRLYFQRAVEHGNLALRAAQAIDPALVLMVARAHQRLGALDRAELGHRVVLKTDPNHVGALTGLAEMQFERRDFVALRATCARLCAVGHVLDAALHDSLQLWAGDNTHQIPKWSDP